MVVLKRFESWMYLLETIEIAKIKIIKELKKR